MNCCHNTASFKDGPKCDGEEKLSRGHTWEQYTFLPLSKWMNKYTAPRCVLWDKFSPSHLGPLLNEAVLRQQFIFC